MGEEGVSNLASGQVILRHAYKQGREYKKELIANGQLLTEEIFCEKLGLDPSEVAVECRNNRFFWLEVNGQKFYPSFYSSYADILPAVKEITHALGKLDGSQKWMFFTRPKGSLGGVTPIEALAKGQLENVLITAQGFKDR